MLECVIMTVSYTELKDNYFLPAGKKDLCLVI